MIDSDLGSEWETGLGTYSAVNTLTRTTVHSSSNSNNIVTFSAGTKNVYISLTGNQLGTLSTLAGSETLTNKTINASNNTITNVSLTSGVTGTLPLANGGTGTTTAQLAINALAGAVTSGSYLRGNGTNVVMATIAAGDVPTLNQNTTGTASGSVSGTASYLAKFTGTNVVGNSQIIDNGTNVGIGTTSPSDKLHVYKSGDAAAKIEGTTSAVVNFTKNAVYCGYIGVGSASNNDIYIYNLASGAVRINNQAVYVTATNLVGVNEQSPGAQLQVTTAAAATKGLIVRGASGQSANLQEWQNSAGTALATVNSAGDFTNSGGYNISEKFGSGATVLGNAATAIGANASANFRSTAVGTGANASTVDLALAIGSNSSVTGSGAVAIGRGSSASGTCSIAIGLFATAATDNSIAIGFSSTANGGISIGCEGTGLGYTSFNASTDNLATTGAIDVYAGDGVNNENFSRQHSMLGTWAVATYASRLGRVQLRVNDFTTDREAIRYESDGANALTSIGGSAIIANTTLAVQPAVSGNKGIVVKGATSQTANLQEFQNSSGTVLSAINSAGNFTGTASGSVSGTASYVPKFTNTNVIGNSQIFDNGTSLGIGTALPGAYKLKIQSASSSALQLTSVGATISSPTVDLFDSTHNTEAVISCISGGIALGAYSNHPLQLLVNATERMRIDTSGNVGIGAVPVSGYTGYRLQVGSSTDSQTYIAIGNSTTGLGPLNGMIVGCDASNAYLLNRESTALRLGTNGLDRILIGADGLVSISAAPIVPTADAQLQVTTAAAATKGLIVRGASAQSANLQEWQNSAGTVLAYVSSNASIIGTPSNCSIGANVACAIMNVVLSHYTLGMNQVALAMFMFLYYKEIKK